MLHLSAQLYNNCQNKTGGSVDKQYKIRPGTIDKIKKAKRLVKEGLEVKFACKRAGISQAWLYAFQKRWPNLDLNP